MDATMSARRLWALIEPIHAVVYFTPEVTAAVTAAGVDRAARYFAVRAAPLGAVSAEVVTALFYGFAPGRVAAALPGAWDTTHPADVVAARGSGVQDALTRLLAGTDATELARAAELAVSAAEQIGDTAGRPLTAANLALLAADGSAEGRLWQAMTVLREHRGEGHLIALAHAEVGPVHAHLLRAAAGAADLAFLQSSRGWSDEDMASGRTELRQRGWLDSEGALTAAGQSVRDGYEAATDRLARAPWAHLGEERTEDLAARLRPLAEQIVTGCADAMTIGLGSPWPPPA